MTPINYEEASKMLGKNEGTLKHAIGRGVFTKLPRQGLYQHLIKEQVELFTNKKRLSLSALNNEERQRWAELDAAVTNSSAPAPVQAPVQAPAPAAPINWTSMLGGDALAYLNETGSSLVVTGRPGADTMAFPSALSGENDSEEEGAVLSDGVLIAILIGLALLFLVYAFSKMNEKKLAEARKIAERTIQDIGLSKGDILEDRDNALEVLRSHPREVETLKYILERENLIPAA